MPDEETWSSKKAGGFWQAPRSLPLILSLIDNLAKGKDCSRVYVDLWPGTSAMAVVEIRERGGECSLLRVHGQRARRSWLERIDVLQDHGFVRTLLGAIARLATC